MPIIDVVDIIDCGQRQRHEGVLGMVVCVVEREKVRTNVFDRQVTIQPRVEEEALCRKGHDDDDDGYRGRRGGGGGRGVGGHGVGGGGRRGRDLFSCPCHSN
jgi:hypothetical protein